MIARTTVLIAERGTSGIKVGGGIPLVQPPNRVDWASMYEELNWTLSVFGVTGAPTAWSVSARFQYRQAHAGQVYRFQTARWFDLAEEQISSHVVEGVGWYGPGQADNGPAAGLIANQASALPLVVSRTLRHFPQGVRVVLDPTFTGGTNPAIQVGLEVTGKGH